MTSTKWALVVGGAGQLGSSVIQCFRQQGSYKTLSVDLRSNPDADTSITLTKGFQDQAEEVIPPLREALKGNALDVMICVAGGWTGGTAKDPAVFHGVQQMWSMNVESAVLTAHLSTLLLRPQGLVVFTGAQAALRPSPGMMGYGVAKAAVHQLITSLAAESKDRATVVGILPNVLDTSTNRTAMPKADHTAWTPLDKVAKLLLEWSEGKGCPDSGSLVPV